MARFGRAPQNQDTLDELDAIYHTAIAGAWERSRIIPDLSKLFAEPKYMAGAGRSVWLHAIKQANRDCQRELDGQRRSLVRHVDLEGTGDDSEQRTIERAIIARAEVQKKRLSRRQVRHMRECLVIFWTLGDSRKWRASLADDRQSLARLVRVQRGASFGILGVATQEALRKSTERLISRMGQGDVLMTDSLEMSEQALAVYHAERVQPRS